MKKALKAIARILHIKAARFAEPEWVAAYEEAARRVEGAPKIGMTRVWREFDKWWKHVYATRRGVFDEQRLKRRKIAALVRAELRRTEER